MKVEVNDIVVVEVEKTKKSTVRHIVKVTAVTSSGLVGTSVAKGTAPTVCELKNVIANLGVEPKTGWVYGYHISGGLEGVTAIDGIDVVLKVKPPEGMLDAMQECMKKFPMVFGLVKFRIEVHGPRGNRLGFWATHKRSDTDTMGVHTPAFYKDEIDHTMVHETGHGIWNRLIDESLRAKFIEAYTQSIDVQEVALSKIRQMAKDFDEQKGSVRTHMKSLERVDREVFKKMIDWIKNVHHITKEDIDRLRQGEFKVATYFPTHALVSSTVLPVITQYATTKPVEFFCEAWAHYWLRRKMPKGVITILDQLCKAVEIDPR